MEKKPHSLDAFLALKPNPHVVVTVEVVDDDHVKLTLRTTQGTCRCDTALVIPKAAIEAVTPTGEVAPCCGKALPLATVEFTKETAAVLNSILSQKAAESMLEGTHQVAEPQFRSMGRAVTSRPICPRGERRVCAWYGDEFECRCEPLGCEERSSSWYRGDREQCFEHCSEALQECYRTGPGKYACLQEFADCKRSCPR